MKSELRADSLKSVESRKGEEIIESDSVPCLFGEDINSKEESNRLP